MIYHHHQSGPSSSLIRSIAIMGRRKSVVDSAIQSLRRWPPQTISDPSSSSIRSHHVVSTSASKAGKVCGERFSIFDIKRYSLCQQIGMMDSARPTGSLPAIYFKKNWSMVMHHIVTKNKWLGMMRYEMSWIHSIG